MSEAFLKDRTLLLDSDGGPRTGRLKNAAVKHLFLNN